MKKIFIALMLLLGLAAGAQARGAVPMFVPERVVTTTTSLEQMRVAIAQAGSMHGWQMRANDAGKATLVFIKGGGKVQAVVDVVYDATGFQIKYVSSVGLNYQQAGDSAMINAHYNSWVESLSKNISREAMIARR